MEENSLPRGGIAPYYRRSSQEPYANMQTKPFVLSAKVIVRDREGRCLLLRRAMSSHGNPGKWDFPGGKIDPGETFDQGLLREIREETGLVVTLGAVAGAAESELRDKRVAYMLLEARFEEGTVRLSEEHDQFAWVAQRALAEADLAPQFKEFAKAYARQNAD